MRKITPTTKAKAKAKLKARNQRTAQAKAAARGAKFRHYKGAQPSTIGSKAKPERAEAEAVLPTLPTPKPPRPQTPDFAAATTATELALIKARAANALAEDLALPIEELDLSIGAYNEAKRAGVNIVGDLVTRTKRYFTGFKRMSQRAADDIQAKLLGMGLDFQPPKAA